MNLQGIVARSRQAFKYILDPNVDLMSPSRAAEFAEIQRQLAELQGKLAESESGSREKDELIAQLREQLASRSEPPQPAPAQGPKSTRKRRTTSKASSQVKTTDAPAQSARSRKKPSVRTAKSSTDRTDSKKRQANGDTAGNSRAARSDRKD